MINIQWIEQTITPSEIESKTGLKVKSIFKGLVGTEQFAPVPDVEDKLVQKEITKKGITIDFETTPTPDQLDKLDTFLVGFKRDKD